jgi:hypothetical protein
MPTELGSQPARTGSSPPRRAERSVDDVSTPPTGITEHRKHLIAAILAGTALDALSEPARWPVPDRVVVVVLEPHGDRTPAQDGLVDDRILVDLDRDPPCMVVAEEDRMLLRRLPADLPGRRAAVGPVVAITDAAQSLHWARQTMNLVNTSALPATEVTWFDHHLSMLWLFSDPFLMREIAERALAPLAGLSAPLRDKLCQTLLVWLETRLGASEIAEFLHVNPKTAQCRLRYLWRVFGADLDDPDRRFEIELALLARRALR